MSVMQRTNDTKLNSRFRFHDDIQVPKTRVLCTEHKILVKGSSVERNYW